MAKKSCTNEKTEKRKRQRKTAVIMMIAYHDHHVLLAFLREQPGNKRASSRETQNKAHIALALNATPKWRED